MWKFFSRMAFDGAGHFNEAGQDRDRVRDNFLNGQGYRVVRIRGYEVLCDGNWVREMIVEEVKRRMQELKAQAKPLTPGPLPTAGRGEADELLGARARLPRRPARTHGVPANAPSRGCPLCAALLRAAEPVSFYLES